MAYITVSMACHYNAHWPTFDNLPVVAIFTDYLHVRINTQYPYHNGALHRPGYGVFHLSRGL